MCVHVMWFELYHVVSVCAEEFADHESAIHRFPDALTCACPYVVDTSCKIRILHLRCQYFSASSDVAFSACDQCS